jgi:glycosyltransferase involved in cell wall biosynthesis
MQTVHSSMIRFLLCSIIFSSLEIQTKPRVSIITSVYKGDEFIEGFLVDITRQTIFNDCELILINAASPGNEEIIINKYREKFSNIIYIKLNEDPGLYAVWNQGIKIAQSELITNANLDDRRNSECIEKQAQALEEDPSVDLVYASYFITYYPNETYEHNNYRYYVEAANFSRQSMYLCLPGPQPMWRKSMHEKYGFFDESFSSAGDLEMWNRAVLAGSAFKSIPGVSGLYYVNPKGISTNNNAEKVERRRQEDMMIMYKYQHMWNS